MKRLLLVISVALAAFSFAPAAPVRQGGFGHYSKDGMTLDYPVAWTLADESNAEMQRLTLRRKGLSTVIMIFAQREPITSLAQLSESHRTVTRPYVENIAHNIGLAQAPPTQETQCVNAGDHTAVGYRMAGRIGDEPTTAEVYTVVMGTRLLHLVNIRADRDEPQSAPAWKVVLDSLKVEPPAGGTPEALKVEDVIKGGVLNGAVITKPQPIYPVAAKRARVQGVVTVEVVVDETGKVISAIAVSGEPLLRGASEDAARRARFTPTTLCGTPSKVSGVITYNFVLR